MIQKVSQHLLISCQLRMSFKKIIFLFRTITGFCNNIDNPTWGMPGSQLHRLVSSAYRYSGIPATQAGQLSIQVQWDTSYTGWLAQHTGIVGYQLHRLVSSAYRYSVIPVTQVQLGKRLPIPFLLTNIQSNVNFFLNHILFQ